MRRFRIIIGVGAIALIGAVGVGAQAAGGGLQAQSVSAAFSGAPSQTSTQQCVNSHEDHSTLTATVTSSTPPFMTGDVIVIHSVSTIDDTSQEGYTTGNSTIFRVIKGKSTQIGSGMISATNSKEGLVDGFITGKLQVPGGPAMALMANFWVQFNNTGSAFTGALGDGLMDSRANQAGDTTDNHAVVSTGDC